MDQDVNIVVGIEDALQLGSVSVPNVLSTVDSQSIESDSDTGSVVGSQNIPAYAHGIFCFTDAGFVTTLNTTSFDGYSDSIPNSTGTDLLLIRSETHLSIQNG